MSSTDADVWRGDGIIGQPVLIHPLDLAYGWDTEATFPWSQRRQCRKETDPAQPRLRPPSGTGSFLLSWGGMHSVLLLPVVLASRNQGIQSGLRTLWEAAPASAVAPTKSRGVLCVSGAPTLEAFVIQKIQELPPGRGMKKAGFWYTIQLDSSLRVTGCPNRAAPPMLQANVSRRCWQGSQNKQEHGKYT